MNRYAELLNSGEFCNARVCSDCLMVVANAEYPDDDRGDWTTERQNALEQNLNTYDVTLGHLHTGRWAETSCFHYGEPCPDDDDCPCARTEFSWSRCGLCETTLGGYRHDAILIKNAELAEGGKQ